MINIHDIQNSNKNNNGLINLKIERKNENHDNREITFNWLWNNGSKTTNTNDGNILEINDIQKWIEKDEGNTIGCSSRGICNNLGVCSCNNNSENGYFVTKSNVLIDNSGVCISDITKFKSQCTGTWVSYKDSRETKIQYCNQCDQIGEGWKYYPEPSYEISSHDTSKLNINKNVHLIPLYIDNYNQNSAPFCNTLCNKTRYCNNDVDSDSVCNTDGNCNCGSNYNSNGTKLFKSTFGGENCNQCANNFYGSTCNNFCIENLSTTDANSWMDKLKTNGNYFENNYDNPINTIFGCSSNGECDMTGKCQCFKTQTLELNNVNISTINADSGLELDLSGYCNNKDYLNKTECERNNYKWRIKKLPDFSDRISSEFEVNIAKRRMNNGYIDFYSLSNSILKAPNDTPESNRKEGSHCLLENYDHTKISACNQTEKIYKCKGHNEVSYCDSYDTDLNQAPATCINFVYNTCIEWETSTYSNKNKYCYPLSSSYSGERCFNACSKENRNATEDCTVDEDCTFTNYNYKCKTSYSNYWWDYSLGEYVNDGNISSKYCSQNQYINTTFENNTKPKKCFGCTGLVQKKKVQMVNL